MKTLFSTEAVAEGQAFRSWREAICERFASVDQRRLDESVFRGKIESTRLGSLQLTRVVQDALLTEVTAASIRKDPAQDGFSVLVKLRGGATVAHQGRDATLSAGDVVVIDRARPLVLTSTAASSSVLLALPRNLIESDLGASVAYAGLVLPNMQAGAHLARGFLTQFATVADRLDTDTASRMSAIGVDLLRAAIAERLGRESSHAVSGTMAVQRAKAYVRQHFGSQDLDPHRLALAVGVSTRRLQELFQQRGHCISEWIWQQRCAAAARLLGDGGHAHRSIGEIAYSCGFSSGSHFSRRFRSAEGASPREFRAAQQRRRGSNGAA